MDNFALTESASASANLRASQANAAADKLKFAGKNREEVRRAAEEFESIFVSQMLGHMFKGLDSGGMFGGGHAEGIYRDLMIDEYGKQVVSSGGIGIADTIERQLLALQEVN
ncbi:rod-binding protein [Nisaea acidiphila]|uniref:Rod-binding protein n=1 Tax=Nisaea acidiphila TaxID=1862145 RepID=A0A9J7AW45_9PROT|nr:rod-binding protein [Nisaea acidiphila]UUX50492.1 rod-binding protein [Nisaea acidiphila]